MKTGEPDVEALRALFTELEFTSLLKELLPVVEVGETDYTEAASGADVEAVLGAISPNGAIAVAVEAESSVAAEEEEKEEANQGDDLQNGLLPLASQPVTAQASRNVAISAAPGAAVVVSFELKDASSRLVAALADEDVPKAIHDYKTAIHVLERQGIMMRGLRHDSTLYSYLLDPTYSSHRLADVALRHFNLKLSGTLAESADITGRLASALSSEVGQAGLTKLYEEMDLPLVPVLA